MKPRRTNKQIIYDNSIPEPNTGCWLWLKTLNHKGYALMTNYTKRTYIAHRISYEEFIGPIPKGLVIDHKCRMRLCVNPEHMEPVTSRVNTQRGNSGINMSSKTHCPKGHNYSHKNNRGQRQCKICMAESSRKSRLNKKNKT